MLPAPASKHELFDEVVPATSAAHLDDVDLKLAPRRLQHRQLGARAGLAGRRLEFVSVYVVDVREIFAATDRASLVGRIAVKSCGAHQIWGSVANLVNTDSVG